VLVAACVGLVKWLVRTSHSSQVKFVDGLLAPNANYGGSAEEFVNKVLHDDGVFVLRILDDNCGSLLASEVASDLYEAFSHSAHLSDKDL